MISFVESILDSEISVVCRDATEGKQIKALGGKRKLLPPRKWKISYSSEDQLISLLAALRDAKIAMAGSSSGWSPSAVFQHFRDKGKLNGTFIEIIWSNLGMEELIER